MTRAITNIAMLIAALGLGLALYTWFFGPTYAGLFWIWSPIVLVVLAMGEILAALDRGHAAELDPGLRAATKWLSRAIYPVALPCAPLLPGVALVLLVLALAMRLAASRVHAAVLGATGFVAVGGYASWLGIDGAAFFPARGVVVPVVAFTFPLGLLCAALVVCACRPCRPRGTRG